MKLPYLFAAVVGYGVTTALVIGRVRDSSWAVWATFAVGLLGTALWIGIAKTSTSIWRASLIFDVLFGGSYFITLAVKDGVTARQMIGALLVVTGLALTAV